MSSLNVNCRNLKESFAHLQRNIEVVETLSSDMAVPKYPVVESMLQVAQKLYLDMVSTNKWSSLTTKANQSLFVAQPGKIIIIIMIRERCCVGIVEERGIHLRNVPSQSTRHKSIRERRPSRRQKRARQR
jgi:hypothetical protein